MHDGTATIVGIELRTAHAITAMQREIHIVPLRIILPHRFILGVVHHDAMCIGDVDAQIERIFLEAPDVRMRLARLITLERRRKTPGIQLAGSLVLRRHLRQQMRGIHQRLFHGLAYTGFDLIGEAVEHKPRGETDDEEITEQQAQGDVHCPAPFATL